MAKPITSENLKGVTGNVYANPLLTTIYTNVNQGNVLSWYVTDGSAQITFPNFQKTGSSGVQGTVYVDDVSTNFTASVNKYGFVTLKNKVSDQTIEFQLGKAAKGGVTGFNVVYLDGDLAYTSKTAKNGVRKFEVTEGGSVNTAASTSDTTNWGTHSKVLNNKQLDQSVLGQGGSDTLNTTVNSSSIQDWDGLPSTYTLTTSPDLIHGTGKDAIINGALSDVTGAGLQTFQSWDTIDGGLGNSTLNVTMNGSSTNPTLSNIDGFNITDGLSAGSANTVDLAGLNTLKSFNYLGNGAASSITLNNIGSVPGAMSIANTGAPDTLRFTDAALAGGNTALNLTLSGLTGGALTISKTNGVNGLETINLTAKGGNAMGGLVVTNLGTTNLNINATDTLNLGAITDVSGAGGLSPTLLTVDASGSVGNVTLSAVANSTVTGGSGDDRLTAQGGQTNSFTGGIGNDTFIFNNGLSATDTITGGLGTNTLQSTSAALVGYVAPTIATITDITALQVSDGLVGTINPAQFGGTITSVGLLAGTAGVAGVTLGAGTATVNIGSATTAGALAAALTLTDTGTAITDTLNLNNQNAGGIGFNAFGPAAVNVNGYETVNLNTGLFTGTAQGTGAITLTPDAGGTTALNLTGANGLATGVITANSINAGSLGGALTMGGASVGAASITGTAYSDTLVGNVATANNITAGDGNDTITGGAVGDIMSGGAGNDQFIFAAGNLTVTDTVDGGTGTNTLNAVSADLAAVTAAANANLTNLQTVQVSNALAATVNLTNIGAGVSDVELQAAVALNAAGSVVTGAGGSLTVGLGTTAGGAGQGLAALLTVNDTGTGTTDAVTLVNRNRTAAANEFGAAAITSNGYESVTLNTGSTATVLQTTGAITINPDVGTNDTTLTLLGANGATVANVIGTAAGTVSVNASGLTTTGLTLTTTGSRASVTGSGVADTITVGAFAATVDGAAGNDTITGGGAAVSLIGGAGDDTIVTGGGNATVLGGDGNDAITGGAGTDSIDAGTGNDTITFGAGNLSTLDVINGGAGTNILQGASADLVVLGAQVQSNVSNIQTLEAQTALAAGATLNVNNISSGINTLLLDAGTLGAASIIGNAGTQTVQVGSAGGAGSVLGGALTVTDTGTATTDSVVLANTNPGAFNTFAAAAITSTGYENVTLNTGAVATAAQTTGIVTITPDTGVTNTSLTIAGANGITLASIVGGTGVVTVDASGITATAGNGLTVTTTGSSTNITGTIFADAVTVGNFASTVSGGFGNDTLNGGTAADLLDGAAGNDVLSGGGGNDTILGGAGNDTISELVAGNASIEGGDGDDTVNMAGTLTAADVINGGSGTNTLEITGSVLAAVAGISNFNILQLDTAATINMANFTGTNTWQQVTTGAAGAYVVNNAAASVTDLVVNTTLTTATLAHLVDSATDSLIVSASTTAAGAGVARALPTLTVNDTNTLTLHGGTNAVGPTDSLTVTLLDAIQASTISITGTTAVSATFNANAAATGTGSVAHTITVDATTSTAPVTFNAATALATQPVTMSGSLSAINTFTGGLGNDVLTGGLIGDALVGGAGNDTINAGGAVGTGAAGDTITGGLGADVITLGSHAGGNDSVNNAVADSFIATADTLTPGAIAAGDTLIFGNGVDVVTGFNVATDVIDGTTAAAAFTPLLGTAVVAGTAAAATEYYLSGNYNAVTGVFTVTANGAGNDTLVANTLAASTVLTNTSEIILVGVNSATLGAANFI